MMWMAEYPDAIARFVARLHEFNLGILARRSRPPQGRLAGIIIWGDVAYKKGMLFSPAFWRQHFKPGVKAMIDECHSHGLPVIYHGCGNVNRIFEDFIEVGVDAYNPLEYKAGLYTVDLRRRLGHRLGFLRQYGMCITVVPGWPTKRSCAPPSSPKLNAAKGGGFIFQSDHSVSFKRTRRELRLLGAAGPRTRRLSPPARRIRFARLGLKIFPRGPHETLRNG